MILAVDAIARSLLKTDFRWAIVAGIYTGLAWWTKYNGWLPLAIEAAALPLLWLIIRQHFLRRIGCFAATTVTAGVVWSPYYISLGWYGGYGPIAANHATYVVGFAGWLDSAGRQIAAQHVMEGVLSAASLAMASVLIWRPVVSGRGTWSRHLWRDISVITGVVGLGWCFTSFLITGVAAIVGIAWSLVSNWRGRRPDPAGERQVVAACLLAAWWAGLLVATPCYWPYPRLVLPWMLASWLGASLCWEQALLRMNRERNLAGAPWWLGLSGIALMLAAVGLFGWPWLGSGVESAIWDRPSYPRIAAAIRETHPGGERAIYTCGEPALLFQLRAAGEPLVAPVREIPDEPVTIGDRAIPTLLILGPHAR